MQILDSFGLPGENNECGAVYSVRAPDVNMCFPPLTWQTYDIDYTAAHYEKEKKVRNASISVKHNGVQVQKDVELTHTTTAAPVPEESNAGPIYLQDHGCPVLFRNIWLVEKEIATACGVPLVAPCWTFTAAAGRGLPMLLTDRYPRAGFFLRRAVAAGSSWHRCCLPESIASGRCMRRRSPLRKPRPNRRSSRPIGWRKRPVPIC